MLEIDYEKLLQKYNSELLTKTRSFNTEEEHLKFWVPNEDKVESVLNLSFDKPKAKSPLKKKKKIN